METINLIEARILGVLIEKSITTPDYYPLTLNSLTTASNQKSNRNPVMTLDDTTVVRAVDRLRDIKFVWQVKTPNSRMPKYEHNIKQIEAFTDKEIAILCELFLRGPQTVGELRTRASRMIPFNDLKDVEDTLETLASYENGPYVFKMPRQLGYKESRYTHLFCGPVEVNEEAMTDKREPARVEIKLENERIENLEFKVDNLQQELETLKKQFQMFMKQFE